MVMVLVHATSQWEEAAARFARMTDSLGKPIDPGIFEAVVALNLLGIRTVASCEGHQEWGVPHPWIDIGADLAQKYRLHGYLSQFYAQYPVNVDCLLGFHGYRLRSAGAAFSALQTRSEQAQKLRAYQQEMTTFSTFLKALL